MRLMDNDADMHLPWRRLLAIAYGMLGLRPAEFWAMTPGEWMLAVEGWREMQGISADAAPAPTRNELAQMMAAFPDSGAIAESPSGRSVS